MTSPTENNNLEMKLSDLQKKFGEEKKAHGETILQLLSAQAQAQTAEAQAAKAQELVVETTLKLDQAREEIRGLRCQTQAQEARTQPAQLLQEAQEEIRSLRAQNLELQGAQVQVRDLEAQIAQLVATEHQEVAQKAQTQELQESRALIKDLISQMAQITAKAQEEIRNLRDQAQELEDAQGKIKDLEAQITTQAHELLASQAQVRDLEAQMAEAQGAQAEIERVSARARPLKDHFKAQEVLETQAIAQALQEARTQEAQVLQEAQRALAPRAQPQEAQAQRAQAQAIVLQAWQAEKELMRTHLALMNAQKHGDPQAIAQALQASERARDQVMRARDAVQAQKETRVLWEEHLNQEFKKALVENRAEREQAAARGSQGCPAHGAQVQEAQAHKAQVQGAQVYGAQVQEAQVYEAKVQGAQVYGAQAQGCPAHRSQEAQDIAQALQEARDREAQPQRASPQVQAPRAQPQMAQTQRAQAPAEVKAQSAQAQELRKAQEPQDQAPRAQLQEDQAQRAQAPAQVQAQRAQAQAARAQELQNAQKPQDQAPSAQPQEAQAPEAQRAQPQQALAPAQNPTSQASYLTSLIPQIVSQVTKDISYLWSQATQALTTIDQLKGPEPTPEVYTLTRESEFQLFCVKQNGQKFYLKEYRSGTFHFLSKTILKQNAEITFVSGPIRNTKMFNVSVSNGDDNFKEIGRLGPGHTSLMIDESVWNGQNRQKKYKLCIRCRWVAVDSMFGFGF